MEVLLPWGKSFLAPRWSVLVSTTAAASFSAEKKLHFGDFFLGDSLFLLVFLPSGGASGWFFPPFLVEV